MAWKVPCTGYRSCGPWELIGVFRKLPAFSMNGMMPLGCMLPKIREDMKAYQQSQAQDSLDVSGFIRPDSECGAPTPYFEPKATSLEARDSTFLASPP